MIATIDTRNSGMNEWTIDARASNVIGGIGGHLYLSFWNEKDKLEIQKINLSRVCSNSINNIEFKSDTEHGLSHKIDTKPQPSTVR